MNNQLNQQIQIITTGEGIATYRSSLNLTTPADYGVEATSAREEETHALNDASMRIRKTTSLKLGAMIADAREKHRFNRKFSLKNVYMEMEISEASSRKYLSVYERTAGIDSMISTIVSDVNSMTEVEVTFQDIINDSYKPSQDNEKGAKVSSELFSNIKKLYNYSIALNGRPTISAAFDEVEEFKTARDMKTGERIYSLLDEAKLFADATDYYSEEKRLKLNQLKEYLVLVAETAKELNSDAWTVTIDEVRYHEAVQEAELPIDVDNEEEVDTNPWNETINATTETETATEAAPLDEAQMTEARLFAEKNRIAGNLDFRSWYMKTYMSYDDNNAYVGVHQKSAAVDELRENIDEWKDNRRRVLARAHPDAGGSNSEFHIMMAVDNLFAIIDSELVQESNERIKDAYGSVINELSLNTLKTFNDEWMEDDEV